jgi:hypothetical protein
VNEFVFEAGDAVLDAIVQHIAADLDAQSAN